MKRHMASAIFVSAAVIISFVHCGSLAADTELKFEKAAFFGGSGDQLGNAVETKDNRIYVAGADSYSGSKALLASYVPLSEGAPIWNFQWADEGGPIPFDTVVFNDLAVTSEGLYAVGYGLPNGKAKGTLKTSVSILAKFPLDPPSGSKSSKAIWVVRTEFFPKAKTDEAFQSVAAVEESGSIFIYVTGYAANSANNSTVTLAKYNAAGGLVWSKTLSDTGEFKKSAGTAVTALNKFIYVAGFSGSGTKKDKFESLPLKAKLWKYDLSGQSIWEKEASPALYPLTSSVGGIKVDMAATGNHIYVVGSTPSADGKGGDGFLLKFDESSALVWEAKRSSALGPEALWYGRVFGMAVGSERLYIAGHTEDVVTKDSAKKNEDAFLLEIDKEYGTLLSTHFYGESQYLESAFGVQVLGKELYAVGRRQPPTGGDANLVLQRYSTLPVIEVKIDIQPDDSTNMIIQDAEKRKAAVVMFATSTFNLLAEVKHGSLTFGRTGNEASWESCSFKDMNQDGLVDYLCHFNTLWSASNTSWPLFQIGDIKGILKGQTNSGNRLMGTEAVRIEGSAPAPVVTAPLTTAPSTTPTTLVSQPVPTVPELAPAPAPPTTTSTTPTTQELAPATAVMEPMYATLPTSSSSTSATASTTPTTTSTETAASAPTTSTSTTDQLAPTTTTSTTTSTIQEPALTATSTEPTYELKSTTTSAPLLTSTMTQEPILEPTLSTTTMTPTAVMEPTLITSMTSTSTTPTSTSTTTVSSTSLQPYTTQTTELSKTMLESQLAMASTTNQVYVPPPTSNPLPPPPQPASGTSPTSMVSRMIQDFVYRSGISQDNLPAWLKPLVSKGREPEPAEAGPEPEQESDTNRTAKFQELGKDAFYKGNYREAIDYFEDAIKLDPRSPELHNNLGLALFKEGKLEEAIEHFSEALKLNPDNTSARENLAIVMAKQKELQAVPEQTPTPAAG